jgi:hypothetical protein
VVTSNFAKKWLTCHGKSNFPYPITSISLYKRQRFFILFHIFPFYLPVISLFISQIITEVYFLICYWPLWSLVWVMYSSYGCSWGFLTFFPGRSRPLPYLGPGPEQFCWEQRKQETNHIPPPPPCSRSATVGKTSRRRPAGSENHWEMGLVFLQDNWERRVISEMGLFDRRA